jgi:hypothetical protein
VQEYIPKTHHALWVFQKIYRQLVVVIIVIVVVVVVIVVIAMFFCGDNVR